MPPLQVPLRAARRLTYVNVRPHYRAMSTSLPRFVDHSERVHPNAEEHRKYQTSKSDNPQMTNTSSTFHNKMPSVGEDKPPPDMITSVDPDYVPTDKHPENTERMTGGTQSGDSENVSASSDLGVGEMEDSTLKIQPLRRTGEDANTMRARLLCPYMPKQEIFRW